MPVPAERAERGRITARPCVCVCVYVWGEDGLRRDPVCVYVCVCTCGGRTDYGETLCVCVCMCMCMCVCMWREGCKTLDVYMNV